MAAQDQTAKQASGAGSSLAAQSATHSIATDPKASKDPSSPRQILLGFGFGIIFGFLLQKGGVAKYHVLMGVLLLEDMTVVKVMLSAITVGMAGIFTMHRLGLVKLHPKPTRYVANVVGGLIFGVGFGLLGYCPGTGSAALGQGNFDALAGMAGLMAGSYVYAEFSGAFHKTLLTWGDRGKLSLPELLHVSTVRFVMICVPLLAVALYLIERLPVKR